VLWIDRREGSSLLAPHFAQHHIETELCTLDYADVFICGNGPRGEGSLQVGVERKTVRDMLNSMRSARFQEEWTGQLSGLLRTYDVAWLVIEGVYRSAPGTGVLQEYRGKAQGWVDLTLGKSSRGLFMHSEIERFLMQLQLHTAVEFNKALLVHHTARVEATVEFCANLHHQLTGKTWDEHRSWRGIMVPQPSQPFMLRQPTKAEMARIFRRRVSMCLDGVGDEKAQAIATVFRSGRKIANGTKDQWAQVPGVGKVLTERIINQWEEEYAED
jgi:ERCC4-type nuclease